MTRTFTDTEAKRTAVPLLVGIYSATGAGKTFSALRIAKGIQRVTGGDVFFIDTESRRALHYADHFDFRHVDFREPFDPDSYVAAIDHCISKGAKTIIIDSMSHEHTGRGGVLEMHEAECQRLMKAWKTNNRNKVQMSAWAQPKAARRRLLARMLQVDANFVCCWRSKEKLQIRPGKDPIDLGWQPEGGNEFPYEMTVMALLHPGAGGVPQWHSASDKPGEQITIKLPRQFEWLRDMRGPMSEEMGERMARWAAGSDASATATFSDKLEWEGLAAWGGKALADAPHDVLVAYGAAVETATAKTKSDALATRMRAHLEDVQAAAEAAKGAA